MTTAPASVPVIAVSRLANYLARLIDRDAKLRLVGIQGEVSEWKPQPNGTIYFKVKDRDAVLECVGWSAAAASFPSVRIGDEVVATGAVRTYAKKSTYQLEAIALEHAGVGALHAKFEALRRELQAAGLFDASRKRPLPTYPFSVALVGSPSGDGTRDFVTQLRRRAPHIRVRLYPSPVQGAPNAPLVVQAITAAANSGADVLVLVRGGGAYEDLFLFNDERIVRALHASAIPTLTAIGHDADSVLADFVADAVAATPSAAAQLHFPERSALLTRLRSLADRASRAQRTRLVALRHRVERAEMRSPLVDVSRLLGSRRQDLDRLRERLAYTSPHATIQRRKERITLLAARLQRPALATVRARSITIERLHERLERADPRRIIEAHRTSVAAANLRITAALVRLTERKRAKTLQLAAQLAGHDPKELLRRGYAMVTHNGRVLRDPADAPPGSRIVITLAAGDLQARVEGEQRGDSEQLPLL